MGEFTCATTPGTTATDSDPTALVPLYEAFDPSALDEVGDTCRFPRLYLQPFVAPHPRRSASNWTHVPTSLAGTLQTTIQ